MRLFCNTYEKTHLDLMLVSLLLQYIAQLADTAPSGAYYIPDFVIGASGIASPVAETKFGGSNIASALQAFGRSMSFYSSAINTVRYIDLHNGWISKKS